MLQKQKKTLISPRGDLNHVVKKFGINQLIDSLIYRLNQTVQKTDTAKTEILVRSDFNYLSKNLRLVESLPVHEKGEIIVTRVIGYHP